MMRVESGLDVLTAEKFSPLQSKRVALLCNQASVAADLCHAVDLFSQAHQKKIFELKALFGPQHGLWGHTQDNMIEWQGYRDKRTGIPVFSLYGEHRQPTGKMLADIDTLVIDLQDVGAKYYTFIWSMALCMQVCMEKEIEVVVLDRPNPLGGIQTEGSAFNQDFPSFVGLHPLMIRHGMTIGEISRYLRSEFYPQCRLTIIEMRRWGRDMYFEQTGLPWVMPSPNMPLPVTAVVYPGMCLLEATNLSEGRGTTRPFEIFGAPWMDGWKFAAELNRCNLPGAIFRPLEFQPTFQKHGGKVCGGCFIHLTERQKFKPFLTGVAIIREAFRLYPEHFRWKQPPYEYEYEKMPFDILVGNDWIRNMIEALRPPGEMEEKWSLEAETFVEKRSAFLLYS
jgi:uncharacterized protein YbbC (DUF1343 family)